MEQLRDYYERIKLNRMHTNQITCQQIYNNVLTTVNTLCFLTPNFQQVGDYNDVRSYTNHLINELEKHEEYRTFMPATEFFRWKEEKLLSLKNICLNGAPETLEILGQISSANKSLWTIGIYSKMF